MNVYASNPWHESMPGKIRNLVISEKIERTMGQMQYNPNADHHTMKRSSEIGDNDYNGVIGNNSTSCPKVVSPVCQALGITSFPLLLGIAFAIIAVSILWCCLTRKTFWKMKCDNRIGDEEVELELEETSYGTSNVDQQQLTNFSGRTDATNNRRQPATNVHQEQKTNLRTTNNAVSPPPSAPEYENISSTSLSAPRASALGTATTSQASSSTISGALAINVSKQNYALS